MDRRLVLAAGLLLAVFLVSSITASSKSSPPSTQLGIPIRTSRGAASIAARLVSPKHINFLSPLSRTTVAIKGLNEWPSSHASYDQQQNHHSRRSVCHVRVDGDATPPILPDDVSDEADIEVRLFILLQQLRIRHKVAMNKGQEEVANEMARSIGELKGLIEERDNRWAPEATDSLRKQLDKTLRTNGPETMRRNLFRKIEAIMNPREVQFKLGSKVIHKDKRYSGVVCGYHPGCRETDEWVEANGILQMLGATARPFYMVLVDVRDVESPVVTYVPEHMLESIKFNEVKKFLPKELQEEKKKPPEVVHPFVYSLFYGQNKNGDYLPTDELMARYGEFKNFQ
eukprot:CAMPEP_0185264262 /NCGR_PEP_ID=MMETSP1359-20130426/21240_1 /TAXON_ID=552665 /ORGANISM="Bigelowiella longifila, Strain CCMP242" /LENGTH=341 /DNA_ID=CAMNT_0027852659 /DNA_START=63 /DNA_END=1088 /DNA_ORIENTATION=-